MPKLVNKRSFVERNTRISYKMLAFINRFMTINGYCPSYREIGLCANITSTSHVSWYINGLIDEDLLTRDEGITRSTHLTEKGKKTLNEWKEIANAEKEK